MILIHNVLIVYKDMILKLNVQFAYLVFHKNHNVQNV